MSPAGPEPVTAAPFDIVCCSLEPWDEVWRRNQFLVDGLLTARPEIRVLFVELSIDVSWHLQHGRWPRLPPMHRIGDTGRLWAMQPRKWLPRRIWPRSDQSLQRQVRRAAHRLGFTRPLLWINDNNYAGLLSTTGWPSVYDVTDDWTLTSGSERETARQQANDAVTIAAATAVVVCSPDLERTRGETRSVHLIPNGVDVERFRAPTTRPLDLPAESVVLYTGTLSESRLDVELCVDLAARLPAGTRLVLVGPDSLAAANRARLDAAGALVLGARPYAEMPPYLQHADLLVVPHVVTPFTESLDPIKAREILAVGRPALSTPVAGFRDLADPVHIAAAPDFVRMALDLLGQGHQPAGPGPLPAGVGTWAERVAQFSAVLDAARTAPAPLAAQPG